MSTLLNVIGAVSAAALVVLGYALGRRRKPSSAVPYHALSLRIVNEDNATLMGPFNAETLARIIRYGGHYEKSGDDWIDLRAVLRLYPSTYKSTAGELRLQLSAYEVTP